MKKLKTVSLHEKESIHFFYLFILLNLSISPGCQLSHPQSKRQVNNVTIRLTEPRIHPVNMERLDSAQIDYLEPHIRAGRLINVFKTAAQHPNASSNFDKFAFYTNSESTLSPRHREMIILRIGWLCQSEYEWAHHSRIALKAGLTKEEIHRITENPEESGWTQFEKSLLLAVDELHEYTFITNETWSQLENVYSDKQMMDVIFTAGAYTTVAMMLNALGVQLEEGLSGFPEPNSR